MKSPISRSPQRPWPRRSAGLEPRTLRLDVLPRRENEDVWKKAAAHAETMIATGQALEKFRHGIRLQGGDERVIDEPERLPTARLHLQVASSAGGFVTPAPTASNLASRSPCSAVAAKKREDKIDHGVGLEFHKRIGDRVGKGRTAGHDSLQ